MLRTSLFERSQKYVKWRFKYEITSWVIELSVKTLTPRKAFIPVFLPLDETGLPLSSWSKSRRFLGELNPLFLAGLLPAFACASLIRCLNLRALLLALAADVGPPGVDLDSLGVDPAAGGAILDTTAGSDSSPSSSWSRTFSSSLSSEKLRVSGRASGEFCCDDCNKK